MKTFKQIVNDLMWHAQERDYLDNCSGGVFARDAQKLREAARILSDPCRECEIAQLLREYNRVVKERDEMERRLYEYEKVYEKFMQAAVKGCAYGQG